MTDLHLRVSVERWLRPEKVARLLDLSADYIRNEWRKHPGLARAGRKFSARVLRFDAKQIARMQREAARV